MIKNFAIFPGWKEPEIQGALNLLHPCLEPACDFNGVGCVHGQCRAPNYCACTIGWDGPNCNQVISDLFF